MAVIYGTPLFLSGGGGQNLTLPPMVTNLAAKGSNATITVSWSNPVSEYLAGIAVVYNDDHMPEKPSDGTKVDAGLAETVDLTGLTNGTLYYIRVFPYNEKKQYQTLIDGATTSATPNIGPAQVTNFQVTGSGSSPVLSWVNPTDDPLYHETVVIQKVGSAPTSLTDGTEIYRGTGTTVTAIDLVRLEEYYFAVFTVDEVGSHRSPVVSEMYSYDFPAEPDSYSEITKLYSSNEWEATEDGWFKIIIAGRGGTGGFSHCSDWGNNTGLTLGSGGGAPGCSVSEVALNKGEKVQITISSSSVTCSAKEITMNATNGLNGGYWSANANNNGGNGGTASGGNKNNYTGPKGGSSGSQVQANDYYGTNVYGRSGGSLNVDGYSFYGGTGGGGTRVLFDSERDIYVWGKEISPTSGSAAVCIILRGNTNIPSPSAASTLSLTPRNASIEASWTNSGDPESVGTILVSSSDHVPVHPTDGTSVDVAGATTYTISDLPNDTPTYVSLFAYNADKTKYSAAKSDVEIPREVTWYDVQKDFKEDIADAQEDAEQAQEVVLPTRDFLPDAISLTLPEIYDEWNPDGIAYIGKDTATEDKPASIVRRNGFLYRCLQSHTSQENWTPENSPSLWVLIDDPAIEWPEWKQPTGAHDAYSLGAKVSHNGKKWISQIEANTVEPGADERYWKEYTE